MFFLWAAVYCAALTFIGFAPTYWRPLVTASLGGFSPIVHIHGALFFSWTLLLFFQSWLVTQNRLNTHRSMGLVGISLATAMVIFGFFVSLAANVDRIAAGQVVRAYDLGFSNTTALLGFAVMFCMAIIKRGNPSAHKRFLLFATCMILTPAVGRLYRPLFAPGPPAPWVVFLTIDVIIVACLVHDLRSLKRIHPVTLGCGFILLSFQILRFQIPTMPWWQATYDAVLSAYMRSVGG